MPYMPPMPIWMWNLAGEDAVFFSRPTQTWLPGEGLLQFSPYTAVARCSVEERTGSGDCTRETPLTDRTVWTYPIQCGMVATITPDGQYVCDRHLGELYTCVVCERYSQECTWVRDELRCCSDPDCLATCTAHPVPCEGCGVLRYWEELLDGGCWECQRRRDTE
jgi:hypothetical protein